MSICFPVVKKKKNCFYILGYAADSIFLRPINKIIPFLPLEKEHIKKCIDNGFVKEGYDITENDYE